MLLPFFLAATTLFPLAGLAHGDTAALPAHTAVDRSGELRVNNGMTLRLNADLGNVRIETLPPNAAPVVRYTVHVETDAVGPTAQRLLEAYALTTRETIDTVLISGALPNPLRYTVPRHLTPRNVQFWVQFVVTVPANFSLDVSTGAGEITRATFPAAFACLARAATFRPGESRHPPCPARVANGSRQRSCPSRAATSR